MTTSLRDALAQRINQVGPAHPDIEELVGLGEQRLRRRRISAVAGAGAAVVLAIAVAVGGSGLNRSVDRNPIDQPTNSDERPTNSHERRTATRPLVYSDVRWEPARVPDSLLGEPIHVGDRVVETGSGWIHMDVTDDGVVYTTGGYLDDGRVWFTDGGPPEQIASHACAEPRGWPHTVVTGNSGSLAAWFDCTRKPQTTLVVYDTGSDHEVVREQINECRVGGCLVYAIIGHHVYVRWTHHDGDTTSLLEFDRATGRVSKVKLAEGAIDPEQSPWYLDDVRSSPRGLVIGDSWETGTPFGGDFAVVDRRLVPSTDGHPTSMFDNATRRPVRLHLPPGYQVHPDVLGNVSFGLFEWLDDDTVALVRPSYPGPEQGSGQDGDILTCRLSSGRCELAVPGPHQRGHERVVPGQALW